MSLEFKSHATIQVRGTKFLAELSNLHNRPSRIVDITSGEDNYLGIKTSLDHDKLVHSVLAHFEKIGVYTGIVGVRMYSMPESEKPDAPNAFLWAEGMIENGGRSVENSQNLIKDLEFDSNGTIYRPKFRAATLFELRNNQGYDGTHVRIIPQVEVHSLALGELEQRAARFSLIQ